jgi:hypothetical protein
MYHHHPGFYDDCGPNINTEVNTEVNFYPDPRVGQAYADMADMMEATLSEDQKRNLQKIRQDRWEAQQRRARECREWWAGLPRRLWNYFLAFCVGDGDPAARHNHAQFVSAQDKDQQKELADPYFMPSTNSGAVDDVPFYESVYFIIVVATLLGAVVGALAACGA